MDILLNTETLAAKYKLLNIDRPKKTAEYMIAAHSTFKKKIILTFKNGEFNPFNGYTVQLLKEVFSELYEDNVDIISSKKAFAALFFLEAASLKDNSLPVLSRMSTTTIINKSFNTFWENSQEGATSATTLGGNVNLLLLYFMFSIINKRGKVTFASLSDGNTMTSFITTKSFISTGMPIDQVHATKDIVAKNIEEIDKVLLKTSFMAIHSDNPCIALISSSQTTPFGITETQYLSNRVISTLGSHATGVINFISPICYNLSSPSKVVIDKLSIVLLCQSYNNSYPTKSEALEVIRFIDMYKSILVNFALSTNVTPILKKKVLMSVLSLNSQSSERELGTMLDANSHINAKDFLRDLRDQSPLEAISELLYQNIFPPKNRMIGSIGNKFPPRMLRISFPAISNIVRDNPDLENTIKDISETLDMISPVLDQLEEDSLKSLTSGILEARSTAEINGLRQYIGNFKELLYRKLKPIGFRDSIFELKTPDESLNNFLIDTLDTIERETSKFKSDFQFKIHNDLDYSRSHFSMLITEVKIYQITSLLSSIFNITVATNYLSAYLNHSDSSSLDNPISSMSTMQSLTENIGDPLQKIVGAIPKTKYNNSVVIGRALRIAILMHSRTSKVFEQLSKKPDRDNCRNFLITQLLIKSISNIISIALTNLYMLSLTVDIDINAKSRGLTLVDRPLGLSLTESMTNHYNTTLLSGRAGDIVNYNLLVDALSIVNTLKFVSTTGPVTKRSLKHIFYNSYGFSDVYNAAATDDNIDVSNLVVPLVYLNTLDARIIPGFIDIQSTIGLLINTASDIAQLAKVADTKLFDYYRTGSLLVNTLMDLSYPLDTAYGDVHTPLGINDMNKTRFLLNKAGVRNVGDYSDVKPFTTLAESLKNVLNILISK